MLFQNVLSLLLLIIFSEMQTHSEFILMRVRSADKLGSLLIVCYFDDVSIQDGHPQSKVSGISRAV